MRLLILLIINPVIINAQPAFYQFDCREEDSCFGTPKDCDPNIDCTIALKFDENDNVDLLLRNFTDKTAYAAFAIDYRADGKVDYMICLPHEKQRFRGVAPELGSPVRIHDLSVSYSVKHFGDNLFVCSFPTNEIDNKFHSQQIFFVTIAKFERDMAIYDGEQLYSLDQLWDYEDSDYMDHPDDEGFDKNITVKEYKPQLMNKDTPKIQELPVEKAELEEDYSYEDDEGEVEEEENQEVETEVKARNKERSLPEMEKVKNPSVAAAHRKLETVVQARVRTLENYKAFLDVIDEPEDVEIEDVDFEDEDDDYDEIKRIEDEFNNGGTISSFVKSFEELEERDRRNGCISYTLHVNIIVAITVVLILFYYI